jgi:hypothetical protein
MLGGSQLFGWVASSSCFVTCPDTLGFLVTHQITKLSSVISVGALKMNLLGSSHALIILLITVLLLC